MGVHGLWSLLDSVKKDADLSNCCGQKMAVDLSSWLVSCAQIKTGYDEDFHRCRSIFLRCLGLLSSGIIPVFVKDSLTAPHLKKRKRGLTFHSLVEDYEELLKALGVPVLQSPGEAEKTCADLNRLKMVDACLADDGDVFVYGAQTVYKGFSINKEVLSAVKYEMPNIEQKLNLSSKDLVAFALLSGSDMCDGVENVGEAKFTKLKKEFDRNDITDSMKRMQSWRTNEDLNNLDRLSDELKLKGKEKKAHCSRCCHEGSVPKHKKSGCPVCDTSMDCRDCKTESLTCPCPYHAQESSIKKFEMELSIRKLAIKTNGFPNESVIREYVDSSGLKVEESHLTVRMPDCRKLCEILRKKLKFTEKETLSYLVKVIIKMCLHGMLTDFDIRPLEIAKTKTVQGAKMYVVKWNPIHLIEELAQLEESDFQFDIRQNLFRSKFMEMAEAFEEKNVATAKGTKGKKRKQDNKPTEESNSRSKHPKMTAFFKIKKTKSTDTPNHAKPTDST